MLPRARTRVSDYVWAGVAVVMAAVLIRRLVMSTAALVADPRGQQLLSLLVVALLSVVAGRWLVGGAWRRTIWGAPAGGVREHRERRLANSTGRETDEQ